MTQDNPPLAPATPPHPPTTVRFSDATPGIGQQSGAGFSQIQGKKRGSRFLRARAGTDTGTGTGGRVES